MQQVVSERDFRYFLDTVREAGRRLLTAATTVMRIKGMMHKTLDLVTQADLDSEAFLRNRLAKRFPSFGFYSEETAEESKRELDKELSWVVDPLDGTLHFSRGLPFFGVSVGLMRKGKPVAGVIYLPKLDELFHAQQGCGAFLNRARITVSRRKYPEEAIGVLSNTGLTAAGQKHLYHLLVAERTVFYRIGSAVWHISCTAAGRYDFYVGINQAIWDLAAGWAIVEEVGGAVDVWMDEQKKAAGNFYHVSFIASRDEIVRKLAPGLRSL